jgi:hypothetical protein
MYVFKENSNESQYTSVPESAIIFIKNLVFPYFKTHRDKNIGLWKKYWQRKVLLPQKEV